MYDVRRYISWLIEDRSLLYYIIFPVPYCVLERYALAAVVCCATSVPIAAA